MAGESELLQRLEAETRQRVSQVKLVCELGLDRADSHFLECHRTLNEFLSYSPQNFNRLSETCPAIYVVVLTVIAAELGTGHELWEPIISEPADGLRLAGLTAQTTAKFGAQYRRALAELQLPDFEHVGGLVNLSPILIHAGIPANSSSEVWRKVDEFIQVGVSSGREIVQDLRGDGSQMQYFRTPAKRFVKEAGEFAVDFFQRMVDAALSHIGDPDISKDVLAARHGLPERLIEVLLGVSRGRSHSQALPPANIFLDIDTGLGPFCVLPPIRERNQQFTWTVCGRNYRSSAFDEKVVQLEPSQSWNWEIMTADSRIRSRQFVSLGEGSSWLFKETNQGLRLVHVANQLEEGLYYLLTRDDASAEIVRADSVESAIAATDMRLGSAWSQYKVLELNLFGATGFLVTNATSSKGRQVEVLRAPLRPALEGLELRGVRGAYGDRVFVEPPTLRFVGSGGDIHKFKVGIKTPSGTRVERFLKPGDLFDGKVNLEPMTPWSTGSYRVEVVGPMGAGMSESFVVLMNGALEVEDRVFAPRETVRARLRYREKSGGTEHALVAEFPPHRDRSLLPVVNAEATVDVKIPRVAFDIGGVGEPPNFSSSALRVLALEDLKQLKKEQQQLHVKTGTQANVVLVCRHQGGSVFHQESATTSGVAASTAFELAKIVDSISLVGAESTEVSVVIAETGIKLPVLRIQQKLQYRITNWSYKNQDGETRGTLNIEVSAPEHGPDAALYLKSLERVWDLPQVLPLLGQNPEKTMRRAILSDVVPGCYSLQLAIGDDLRPLRSSYRKIECGSPEQRTHYASSLIGDDSRIPERIAFGETITFKTVSPNALLDTSRVAEFFVARQRDFSTKSAEFTAVLAFLGREGAPRLVGEWMTHVDAAAVTVRELENAVVRLLPLLSDAALHEMVDSRAATAVQDTVHISRLWNLSPLIGMVFTSRMQTDMVTEKLESLRMAPSEPNFEQLAELSMPALNQLISESGDQTQLLSRASCLVHFRNIWTQCWTGRGPNYALLDHLEHFTSRGRDVFREAPETKSLAMPPIVAVTVPEKLRHGRRKESFTMAKFINHIYRTAWLASIPETPYVTAFKATELLAESYGFAKGLTDRAICLHLMTATSTGRRP